jgi:hypothetical protein
MADWWRYLSARQLWGCIFAAAGIALTFWAAFVKRDDQKLLLAVIAAFVQITAAYLFSGHGKADKTHATSAIGRLLSLAGRVDGAERSASESFERNISAGQRRDVMGALSVELSWIGEGVRSSVVDWIVFNPHLAELVSDEDRPGAIADAKKAKSPDVAESPPQTAAQPTEQLQPDPRERNKVEPAQDAPIGDGHD